ncbi:1-acyl-sn-glycerol-3-phosphate acyltransferase [Crocinitomicaceae bacterium CZZ-1]|uniref:1-acyl-sn-glycerol-3-phosphate acyltransferase n=1 Tax=Taishania pollutisoli TaxID=2766479 RepID=A0A8J6PN59_9FLAO|nr:1-acyl-sn-glycerol-3-phosphate acyltransferase [Taishania pollutisoli]MBC9811328.1 1-acyl-sn-glycerol-3-phosphate acyltransferase [Taishania pollutisoli]
MMRFFYFMLKITLPYTTRMYYPRQKIINEPKERFGRTIYVSNHTASFMDPLVVAGLRRPIVFFMTRSDVFTPVTKPILWAAHMLPIYREHDGEDTKGKNAEVFRKCAKVLSFGRNLLIFGEGFTDDVFIRRLKPVKKGAVRIGFSALEELKWQKKIYIAAVGCNYSEPNEMRSDLLIATSDKICLNDYKQEYEENPNKVITELTRRIEVLMREQITHVDNKEMAPFHENVMKITRKGMNARCSDTSIPLEKRWKYSQQLANWFNEHVTPENEELMALKKDLESYFSLLRKFRLDEKYVYEYQTKNGSRTKELLFMLTMWPFAILGLIHCGIPYMLCKRFVEKTFRRKVFWGSVKLLTGKISMGLLNIPFIFLFYKFVYPSYWLAFAYYLSIGLFGLAAYMWFRNFKAFKIKGAMKKMDIGKFWKKRTELAEKIKQLIPVA